MTFAQAVRTCFAKYFTFSGRATRPEYWWFFLFCILGGFVCGFLDFILFGAGTYESEITDTSVSASAEADGPLATVFGLATLIPTLSAGWRRMHDTGRSGLYLLYPLIAMAGLAAFVSAFAGFENLIEGNIEALMAGGLGIVLIIALIIVALSPFIVLFWLTRPSQQGENQYGPNPHEVSP
ncbi:MAG: DUF805 domain-containing protein [Pseudomonadota bacterium]